MTTHNILLNILLQAEEEQSFPWWLVILILAILMLIVIWALARNAKATETPHVEHTEAERAPEPIPPAVPDDLKLIEGIGPKISSLLNEAGIMTFAQLANTPVADLQAILDKAGLRLGDPATWPEQAALAAKGDLAGLQTLQDALKGGRRV
jgi:predicted flap endonuclease-1-like 5' DNA nuclease